MRITLRTGTVVAILAASLCVAQSASAAGKAAAVATPAATQADVVILNAGTVIAPDAAADGVVPTRTFSGAVTGYAANLDAAQLARVKSDPNVVMVTADQHFSPTDSTYLKRPRHLPTVNNQPTAGNAITSYRQFIPTALERVGLKNSVLANVNGRGPNVNAGIAVIDSGITPNPDLNIAGGVNCSDEPTQDLNDPISHGTEVASVAAAIDNGFGVVGAAPGARLYNVKVSDNEDNWTLANVICGLNWVIAHHNVINVANMSFEDTEDVLNDNDCGLKSGDAFHYAVCKAQAAGITLVAGSGNDGTQITQDEVPQVYPEVITVGGYQDTDGLPGGRGTACGDGFGDADDMWAPWTDFGPSIDVMAVADCIQAIANDGTLEWDSGTSFAGPAVSGAAADLSAHLPFLGPKGIEAYLKLTATHRNLGANPYGYGLLNMAAF